MVSMEFGVGQDDVGDDQRGIEALEQFERVAAVQAGLDLMARHFQRAPDDLDDAGIVVNNQDTGRHTRPSNACAQRGRLEGTSYRLVKEEMPR